MALPRRPRPSHPHIVRTWCAESYASYTLLTKLPSCPYAATMRAQADHHQTGKNQVQLQVQSRKYQASFPSAFLM